MALNDGIHFRLRRRRLIGFIVAATAIANEVDNNVLAEFIAEVQGELSNEKYGLWIVRVDVENRRLNHARNVCTVLGGASIVLPACREADLIVNDYVNCAASRVSAGLRHLESLHNHALARESRITVNDYRKHFGAVFIASANLTRAYRALDNRGYDLEMRWIKRHRHVDFAARGHNVRRKALVVLHIAGALIDRFTLEFVEKLRGILA